MGIQLIYQILNLLIGALALGIGVMAWGFFARWRNARETEGKMLCHFFTAGGGYYYKLCKEDKGKVEPPEGHDVGHYLVRSECTYGGKWKPGQMKWIQVGVRTTAYIENRVEPIVSTNPDLWISSPKRQELTAAMLKTIVTEASMKTAQVLQMGVWKDITSMAQFIKRVPLMFLISLGTVALLLFILYMNYSALQGINALLQRGY